MRDGMGSAAVEVAQSAITSLISHCEALVGAEVSLGLAKRIDGMAEIFAQSLAPASSVRRQIFTFHVPVPESCSKISYIDVQHDHLDFDYDGILVHFVECAARTNPDAQLIIVTAKDSALPPLPAEATIVRLDLDPRKLMFERATSMAAFVAADTAGREVGFFDTDAFLNRPLDQVFASPFEIGLTERPSQNFYMPINEGVIYARPGPSEVVRKFFKDLIGVYEAMIEDQQVRAYYGDITRWRGGQLALNAVSQHRLKLEDVNSRFATMRLPCHEFNFWVEPHLVNSPLVWKDKSILHLKGDSKYAFSRFRALHSALLLEKRA